MGYAISTPTEHALVLGRAGAIPAAPAADQADFLVEVPFDMTLTRLKASSKTAPAANTTLQIRRSVDSGAAFANAFGAVTINAGARVGASDPADFDVDEGDVLGFSVTNGDGSGTNPLIEIVGVAR